MMLLGCSSDKTVPVVDAGGTTLPAWPRFMSPAPLPKVTAETDARTAWAGDRTSLKVCTGKLVRGKSWYRGLAADLAGKSGKAK